MEKWYKILKINELKYALWLTIAPPVIIFCIYFFPDFKDFLEFFIGTGGKIPLLVVIFVLLVMQITGLFLWLKMIGYYLFRKLNSKNK